jgi:hypothetical protein
MHPNGIKKSRPKPKNHVAEANSTCIIHGIWGTRLKLFQIGARTMPDIGTQEQINRKWLAVFLIGGSLGAIIMSWIAYSAMVGRAL